MGRSDPFRTWFLQYRGYIENLIPKAKHTMVGETSKGRYEKVTVAKMDAEASEIVFTALMTAWDFRVRSIKLHRHGTSGVDSN